MAAASAGEARGEWDRVKRRDRFDAVERADLSNGEAWASRAAPVLALGALLEPLGVVGGDGERRRERGGDDGEEEVGDADHCGEVGSGVLG